MRQRGPQQGYRIEGAPYLTYMPYNNVKLRGLKVTFHKVYGQQKTATLGKAPAYVVRREGLERNQS